MADLMGETAGIHALVRRARRRLRWQAAFEWAATAAILASAAALVVVYLWRREVIGLAEVRLGLAGATGIIFVGGLLGAARRFPTAVVASRVDRACGLSDRLATACDFERSLAAESDAHEETRALMAAAIRDAVRALPRADVVRATPFAPPRDLGPASLFFLVAAAVGGLYFPAHAAISPAGLGAAGERDTAGAARRDRPDDRAPIDEDDIFYSRDLLDELRRTAERTEDQHLQEFVDKIDQLLAKAETGEISKEKLLEELARAEKTYMEGADDKIEQTTADLKESGKELRKEPVTRELGKALEQGDMEKAKQELEKLADKIDKDELKPAEREKAAQALEKTAEKFEKKDQQREQKTAQELEKKQEEVRRLQKKQEESKDPQEKRRLAQRLDKEKRELKRLEREKQQQESAQKRTLKRLHRDLKEAAQDMRQQDQQNRRQASRKLKQGAEDVGKVDQDMRRVANQKKVASQMGDLKEALRRARRDKNNGRKDPFGKNARNQDFQRRARGGQGSRQAWRPGSQAGKEGRIADRAGRQPGGNQPGQPGGDQPGGAQGGDEYGDQHDPNLLGDPTAPAGKTVDEDLQGKHGRGPSKRETVLAAAQKGFASQAYGRVYAEYRAIIEEVMRTEKVPSGYKFYVKRYFQKIKPHPMD